ncbi:MAG: SulP family inorganic anion transporter, partial [Opitutae bacterium]
MPTKRGVIRFFTFFKRLPAESRLDFLPALKVLRDYDSGKLKRDFLAGINVSLLAFPQGMAYAMIAGLPIEYGLYGSAVALIIGMLFAGSHFVVLGPTNATSVLLLSTFSTLGMVTLVEKASVVPSLLLLVGLFLVLGAMLRTASLIQYVSRTVVTGYIMAAASLIIVNQVQSLLGFQFGEGDRAVSFFDVTRLTLEHLYKLPWESGATWYPLGLGVVTLLIYLLLQRRLRFLPNVALTLVLASFVHAFFTGFLGFENRVEMLASPAAGSLQITWPQFSLEQFRMLFGTALALALLCVLEGLSIGKSLAARKGLRLDANQEMFSMGMANLGCSLLSGMAASGSLTRSALNASSGAATQVSSLISGVLCLVGVFTLGQFIGLVPKPCLAVMVMVIGVSLFNLKQYRMVTRATFSDSVVFWITLVTGLFFALDFAIYVGVGASILLYLRKAAEPHLVEYGFTEEGELQELEKRQRSDLEISIVHVEGELFFG